MVTWHTARQEICACETGNKVYISAIIAVNDYNTQAVPKIRLPDNDIFTTVYPHTLNILLLARKKLRPSAS
jgi:hypothetical protein